MLVVQEVCVGGSGTACEKVKFTEGGKFAGSTLGGARAPLLGRSICLGLTATAAIGGFVCTSVLIGIGALVGAEVVGLMGEEAGEILYEKTR